MFPSFLKIAVVQYPHFVKLDKTIEDNITFTGGIQCQMVEILSRLYNFKYKLLSPKDEEFGVQGKDGQFSGIIGMVNKSEADIGLGPLTLTAARLDAVHFIAHHTDATTLVTEIPKQVPNANFYMDPFDSNVWIALSAVLMIFSLIYSRFQKILSYNKCFFRMFGYFMKQASQNAHQDILLASWIIFTCIITLSYSAVLFSFMAVPHYEKGVETFKELAGAISRGTYKCYAYSGSADTEFLMNSFDSSLQYISHQIFQNNWLVDANSEFPRNVEEINGTNIAMTGTRSVLQMERDSDITAKWFVFNENIDIWQAGIVVRKNFCCIEKLSKSISIMISAGIYHRLYDLELHREKVMKYKSYVPDIGDKTITMRHIFGAFTLLVGGYVVSCVVLVCEILLNMPRKRKLLRVRRKKKKNIRI